MLVRIEPLLSFIAAPLVSGSIGATTILTRGGTAALDGSTASGTSPSWFGYDSGGVDLTLFENDEEVFGVNCGEHDDEYSTQLCPFDIKAFKKHGNWATMLIQMQAEMRIKSTKLSADMRRTSAKDIATKFEES